MSTAVTTVAEVAELIGSTLGIEDRVADFGPETPLLGELPELDSLGVVQLVVALEERFGIQIEDSEFSGELFETLGTLSDFVSLKRG